MTNTRRTNGNRPRHTAPVAPPELADAGLWATAIAAEKALEQANADVQGAIARRDGMVADRARAVFALELKHGLTAGDRITITGTIARQG